MIRCRRRRRLARPLVAAFAASAVLALTACGTISTQQVGSPVEQPSADGTGVRIEFGEPSDESAALEPWSPDDTEGGSADGGLLPPPFTIVAEATVAQLSARTAPSPDAPLINDFVNPTSSGAPLVFRLIDSGAGGSPDWIEVQLPIQPNGTTGWILRQDVTLYDNPYRIEIDRGGYSLKVFDRNELWVQTTIAVGNGATPTPVGEFYLTELLAPLDPGGPYGPFAFGLSGFSEVLDSFGGADEAIIGLHGTNDPSSLGTDVSYGCIRLENDVIETLAQTLPLGTPVTIT